MLVIKTPGFRVLLLAAIAFFVLSSAAMAAELPVDDQYGNPTITEGDLLGGTDANQDTVPDEADTPSGNADTDQENTTTSPNENKVPEAVASANVISPVATGTLPLTGSEVIALIVGGALLLSSGLLLRTVGSSKE